jgi:hypothetical protein
MKIKNNNWKSLRKSPRVKGLFFQLKGENKMTFPEWFNFQRKLDKKNRLYRLYNSIINNWFWYGFWKRHVGP